jgi:hypothetical protein
MGNRTFARSDLGRALDPDEVGDRAADCWEPLLAIADLADDEWPIKAREAALALSVNQKRQDDFVGVRMLSDLQHIFMDADAETIFSKDLCHALNQVEEGPWANWKGKESGLRTIDLARLLAPLEITPRTVRIGGHTQKGYKREWFEDAWSRYLTPGVHSSRPSQRPL